MIVSCSPHALGLAQEQATGHIVNYFFYFSWQIAQPGTTDPLQNPSNSPSTYKGLRFNAINKFHARFIHKVMTLRSDRYTCIRKSSEHGKTYDSLLIFLYERLFSSNTLVTANRSTWSAVSGMAKGIYSIGRDCCYANGLEIVLHVSYTKIHPNAAIEI